MMRSNIKFFHFFHAFTMYNAQHAHNHSIGIVFRSNTIRIGFLLLYYHRFRAIPFCLSHVLKVYLHLKSAKVHVFIFWNRLKNKRRRFFFHCYKWYEMGSCLWPVLIGTVPRYIIIKQPFEHPESSEQKSIRIKWLFLGFLFGKIKTTTISWALKEWIFSTDCRTRDTFDFNDQ